MRLQDLLRVDCVQLGSPPVSKEETIFAMVDLLHAAGLVESTAPVVRALLERERVMSTGIGGGIALPHAVSPSVKTLAVAVARPREPIDFAALDGEPVKLIFLIVGPGERTALMRVLKQLSRLLYTGEVQKKILKLKTPSAFIRLMASEEDKIGE